MYNQDMHIEFDPKKSAANVKKRGIDFADVEPVFYDPQALTIEDHDHDEQRFVTLGMDGLGRLLVVAYTYRDEDTIRIISAREADAKQRSTYLG